MYQTWQERAKACLREQGRRQADLAEALDCSRGTVSHYFSGRRRPGLAQLERMAREFRVTPGWLVFGESEQGSLREPKAPGYSCSNLPASLARAVRNGSVRGLATPKQLPRHLPVAGRHAYVLEVRAEIYSPRLRRGEFAVFDARLSAHPGDDVLAPCAQGDDWELCELRRRRARHALWLLSIEDGQSRLLASGRLPHPLLAVYCRLPIS